MSEKTIETIDLTKEFKLRSSGLTAPKTIKAVDNVSLTINKGEVLGLVGESGSGKTTIARLIMGLIKPSSGSIEYHDDRSEIRPQMIFQDPYSSLNPRKRIVEILSLPINVHLKQMGQTDKINLIVETLKLVGLDQSILDRYPHEFSGGQRQRIGIARAIILNPSIIICDEPVSALDVSIQAQILNLLNDLKKRFNLSYLFISHDLSVVNHIADRIAVCYLGQIVEEGDKETIFTSPLHPYTKLLLSSIPENYISNNKKNIQVEQASELNSDGCLFYNRCSQKRPKCTQESPPILTSESGHKYRCFYP